MEQTRIHNITPEELKKLIEEHRESDYILLDVRQAEEYTQAHIPGAKLIPLPELESRLREIPGDRELVFYCRSGSRSLAGATFVTDSEIAHGTIYNLAGGITAWNGETLPDFPRLQAFDKTKSHEELLLKAMDLEKGAWRFYGHILERFASESFSHVFEELAKAELTHARIIYHHLEKVGRKLEAFDTVFEKLEGELVESGESLENALQRVEDLEGNLCLNLMELSLNVEYSAFDLHRTIAEQAVDAETKDAFLSIAQAEKRHMRTIAKAIDGCEGLDGVSSKTG
jgi:rhodanese-related sulfurtransferase/rubrerythrin